MHRVLAADLVDQRWHAEGLFHPGHDVEVRHARLYHHHVGAFGNVEGDFTQRLVAVGGVHLVGAFVALAQARGRADRVAERAVIGRRILGRVGQDAHVHEAGFVERMANPADTAIHHVGGRDHIAAGSRLHNGLQAEHVHGFVVDHVAVAQQAIVAMAGVGIEGHVAHDADVGHRGLHGAHGPADEVLPVQRFVAVGRLAFRRCGRKQSDGRDAQVARLLHGFHEQIERQPIDARHRGHRRALLRSFLNEDRPDEIVGTEAILGDETAQPGMPAIAPRPGLGILANDGLLRMHGANSG